MNIDRRQLCKLFGFSLLTPYSTIQAIPYLTDPEQADPSSSVFPLSVASGDPAVDGVVLWTKLAADRINQSSLFFQVATDRLFEDLVYTGEVGSSDLQASRDYTVSCDLKEEASDFLTANTRYYYRFIYDGVPSRIGRFKTLPETDEEISKCKFALLTCQDYSSGYFHAFRHIAEEDLDFVLHLGDFVYEYARYPDRDDLVREVDLNGRKVAESLQDFRTIYQTYRKDKNLQRAMENHTWIITWDDHETANNCYWDYDLDTLGLEKDHPVFEKSAKERRQLKRDSQQAWLEYVPARVTVEESQSHPHDYLKIFRDFKFGDLFDLFMIDTRTYRTKQACVEEESECTAYSDEVQDYPPANTMLGKQQRDWLINGVQNSRAIWKLIGNQTLVSQFGLTVPIQNRTYSYLAGYDGWDGYQSERRLLLETFKDAQIDNLVILTGDFHTYLASLLKIDYDNTNNFDRSNLVGLELMTPSISSANFAKSLSITAADKPEADWTFMDRAYRAIGSIYGKNAITEKALDNKVKLFNLHFKDFGAVYYGYTIVEMDRKRLNWSVYHVDPGVANFEEAPKILVRQKSYDPENFKVR